MLSRRAWFRGWAILTGVVIAIVAVEGALRIHNPLRSSVKFNRVVLHVNNRIEVPRKGPGAGVSVYTTNSLGFRGPEPPADFAGSLTVLAIGGSTTEDFYNDDETTWPLQAGRLLQPHFPKLWLNNAGIAGHSTLGHIALVRDYVSRLKPKAALFLVGVNDVGTAEEPEAVDRSFNFLYNNMRPTWRERFTTTLLRSELVGVAVTVKRQLRATRMGVVYDPAFHIRAAQHREVSDAQIQERLVDVRARLIPVFERRLRTIVALCRGIPLKPIFMTQPAIYGEGVDPATGIRLDTIAVGGGRENGREAAAVLQEYNRVLVEIGAQNDIPVIDLAAQLPRRSDLYSDLIHYSAAGSTEVARIVARELEPILRNMFPEYARPVH